MPRRVAAKARPRDLLYVFAGGAIGATARVAFSAAFPVDPGQLPWPTLVENLLGAFLLGMVGTVLLRRAGTDPRLRLLLGTGVLGSFTTYSTFAVELQLLLRGEAGSVALVYATLSLVVGVGAAIGGVLLGRRLQPTTEPGSDGGTR